MKIWIAAAVAVLCLLSARAEAQCATSCATVAPKHPVILVHGRNDTAARWDTLAANWTTRGYTEGVNLFRFDATRDCGANNFCANLPGYSGAFVNESYARCLAAFIDAKVPCGSGGCPAVDIVTHSQGGVVARYYARFLANRPVDDLVVMSAPHNGISNCTLVSGCSGVNPEDCPNSALMKKLNGVSPYGDGTNDETPAASAIGPTHYAAVVSDGDNVVPPWCGSYFLLNPNAVSGSNLDCRAANYSVDPDSASCKLSKVQHLVVPTNASAIAFAYCEVNKD